MNSRKGFLPLTPARSLKPELTSSSTDVTQDRVANVLFVDEPSSVTSNIDAICNSLRRFTLLSASSKSDSTLEHPDAPFTSLIRRATPTPSSLVSSRASSHSRASSRSREELAADIRRIIPPSNLPPASERIAAASFWPRSTTLSKHSSNASNASTTSLRTLSPALSVVPGLTPSKSDSAFDTTSTRKSFAPAAEPRNLYGPLLVDETCFDFDAEDKVPDVTWTLITKDNPFLLNNCVAKINTVWSGDESLINATLVDQPAPNRRKNLKIQAKHAKAQRIMAEQQWQEVKKMAVSYQVQKDGEHAKKVELAEKISKALKAQDVAHKQEKTKMGKEVPLLSIEGKLSTAEGRLSKSTIGQQLKPQERLLKPTL